MAEIIENLDVAIEPFFTKEELNQLAEESGFIQRQRKLHGHAPSDIKGINRILAKDSVCFQIDESLVEKKSI